MTQIIRISHTLKSEDTVFPGNPKVEITAKHQFEKGDCCNTFEIKFFNHNGTHIDFPNHYVESGKALNEYEMKDLVFDNPLVLRILKAKGEPIKVSDLEPHVKNLNTATALLLITGHQKLRATPDFSHGPYITRETATWLRANAPKLQCIGLDLLSITSLSSFDEGQDVHRILLGGKAAPFVIEDMNLLPLEPSHKIKRLFIAPWFIEKLDGGPCTAFVEVES